MTVLFSSAVFGTGGGGGSNVKIDNITITKNAQKRIQTVGVIDQNSGYKKIWTGTLAQYEAIATKDENTLYIIDGDMDGSIQKLEMPTPGADYENDIVQYVGATTSSYTNGYWYKCINNSGTYSWNYIPVEEVINNVTSTDTNKALSANMGKELQDQITHLKSIGRFLSLWDCTNGLPQTNPTTSPYTYTTGSYYIIGTVSTGTNYRPDGSSYTTGVASTVVESETVAVGYIYWYDGSAWKLMQAESGTITDVQVAGTSVVTSGIANIGKATTSALGVVKPDGTTITVDANGVISGSSNVEVDNTTITKNASNQIQTIGIIDQNTGYNKVWHGTKAAYEAITTKDTNTIYFVSDGDNYGIQVYTMPTASADYENMALQYLGTTTSTYTQGYWYICTASGSTYSWSQLNAQPNVDVQINGTSIVSSGVANIPYASSGVAGVLKTSSAYAFDVSTVGVARCTTKTMAVYEAADNNLFIGKGTLENVITGRALETQTGTITSGTSLTMASNYVYSGTSLTSVILAYPSSPTATFTAQANFTTGSTTPTFSIDSGAKMFGDDVSNSVFTPVANASYSIMFSYVNSVKTGIVIKIS